MKHTRLYLVIALIVGVILLLATAAAADWWDLGGWWKQSIHWMCPGGC